MNQHDPIQREIEQVLATAALVPFSEQIEATKHQAAEDVDANEVRELIQKIAVICERRNWPGCATVMTRASEGKVGSYGFTHLNTCEKDQLALLISAGAQGEALVIAAQLIHRAG